MSFTTPWGVANEFVKDGCTGIVAQKVITKNLATGDLLCVCLQDAGQVDPYVEPPEPEAAAPSSRRKPSAARFL